MTLLASVESGPGTMALAVPVIATGVEWPPPSSRNPVEVFLRGLSPGSRRTMRGSLGVIALLFGPDSRWCSSCWDSRCRKSVLRPQPEWFPWPALRYEHARAIRAELAARYRPATGNKILSALKGVLRECWRLEYLDSETYQRAVDLESVPGDVLPRGRQLTPGEIEALFSACSRDRVPARGARDAALLGVAYGAGLRRSEVVDLNLADYARPAQAGEVGELVVRRGKGNRERRVYLPPGAVLALEEWLKLRGGDPGTVFVQVNKAGRLIRRRLSPEAVREVLRRRAREANVAPDRPPRPHDLRRNFITHLLQAGVDLSLVRFLAGHATVTTTQRYDTRGEEAKKRATATLHVPYAPPARCTGTAGGAAT